MSSDAARLVLPSRRDDVEAALQRIMRDVECCGMGRAECFAVRLALEEALSNALRHGNQNDPAKHITLAYRVTPDSVEVEVEDEGSGFVPDAVPDPTLDENIVIPSGRGLMLMRAYMSEVCYNDRGNRVYLRYNRSG